jgi:hypothetical protein
MLGERIKEVQIGGVIGRRLEKWREERRIRAEGLRIFEEHELIINEDPSVIELVVVRVVNRFRPNKDREPQR